jgi:hypothetical protein
MLTNSIRPRNSVRPERVTQELLSRATVDLAENLLDREKKLYTLFEARAICSHTPIMASGWSREMDPLITSFVVDLLSRQHKISLLEIGAGTTWGRADMHFGVPGLARILKHAFPEAVRVLATDREAGFDLFFVSPDGLLVHHQYRDDRPPKGLDVSMWKTQGTLAATPVGLIARSCKIDPEFAEFLNHQRRNFDIDALDYRCRLYVRPRIDNEVEALLYGVHAQGGINYYELADNLQKHGHYGQFDLVYARHLCPVFSRSRLEHIHEELPPQLQQVARNGVVHFDHCLLPDGSQGDLIFRHHTFF